MAVFDATMLFLAFLIAPRASREPTVGMVAPPGMLKGTLLVNVPVLACDELAPKPGNLPYTIVTSDIENVAPGVFKSNIFGEPPL